MSNEPRFLIIDPQRAFHPAKGEIQKEKGPLDVKGANEDSERIIKMLNANGNAEVYVSLDSHTIKHIGHYGFWKRTNVDKTDGDSVESLQGNQIHYEQIFGREGLFIKPPGKAKVYIKARDQAMRTYAINYVKKLQEDRDAKKLGKVPMLWPTHCIITDRKADKDKQNEQVLTGRAIYAPLFEELKGREKVKYYKKGENEETEMYSIFKSELDPADIGGTPRAASSVLKELFDRASDSRDTGELSVDEIRLIQEGSSEFGSVPVYNENGEVDYISSNLRYPYLVYKFNDNPGSLYSELIKQDKIKQKEEEIRKNRIVRKEKKMKEEDKKKEEENERKELRDMLTEIEEQVDIYICGQALSHCVNYSLRDLVEKLIKDNQQHVKVHLVLNCSSTVVLTGIESAFFGNSLQLIDDILRTDYNKYCDIVFWNDSRSKLVPSPDDVEKTKGVFDSMKTKYVESEYQFYLYDKLFNKIRGEVGLTAKAEEAAKEAAKEEAEAEEEEEAEEAEEPVKKKSIFTRIHNSAKRILYGKKGGKRTKKKRHSKTQKKRKGQIKNSKRHRRSRK
jgi:hypothetical protein